MAETFARVVDVAHHFCFDADPLEPMVADCGVFDHLSIVGLGTEPDGERLIKASPVNVR